MRKNFERNPFVDEMDKVKVVTEQINNYTTRSSKNDTDTRIITSGSFHMKTTEIDNFAKMFFVKNLDGLLKELTPTASKLLLYVITKLRKDSDVIELTRNEAMDILEVASPVTATRALRNIQECGILRRKGMHEFWINPRILFCGNRKEYYQKNYPEKIQSVRMIKKNLYDGKPNDGNTTYLIEE